MVQGLHVITDPTGRPCGGQPHHEEQRPTS